MPVKKDEVGILTKEEKPPAPEEIVKPKTTLDMNASADNTLPS